MSIMSRVHLLAGSCLVHKTISSEEGNLTVQYKIKQLVMAKQLACTT